MKRPFLSLVVPCYNSGKYIERLLQSIVDCKMDDIEVILADDCSPEDYQEHIDKFSGKLNIIQCHTPKSSGCPTNARELGVTKASGIYLTFMDHDDWMIPGGLHQLRQFVESNDYPEYVICGIRQCNNEGETEYEKYGCLDFLHGKFFKLDEFYRKCDMHFKPDIFYKEDTWLTCQANCNCIKYNIEPLFTDFCTYAWLNNPNSLGHRIEAEEAADNKDTVIGRFKTNLDIEYDIYFKYFDEGSLPLPVATEWFLRTLLNFYFDIMMNYFCYEDLEPLLVKYLNDIKSRLQMDNRDIIQYVSNGVFYDQLHEFLECNHREVIPHIDFVEFLNIAESP